MEEWRGAPVAKHIYETLKPERDILHDKGVVPTLGILRVGAKEDDLAYERGITSRFEKWGGKVLVKEFPEAISQVDLEKVVVEWNENPSIHGILVFNPLPKNLQLDCIREIINPKKDIDGLGYRNLGYLYAGDNRAYAPCTAQAVLEILDYYGESVRGKKITVIGRSLVIGKPVFSLLLKKDATVTVCHTKTKDLQEEAKRGDILVVSAGVKKLVTAEYLKEGQIVVDVGIHEDGDSLCGDVDITGAPELKAYTPVPGGVGAVTTAVLFKHVVQSAIRHFV